VLIASPTCELDQHNPQPTNNATSSKLEIATRLLRLEELLAERTSGPGVFLRQNEEHVPERVKTEHPYPRATELSDQIQGLAKDVS